MKIEYIRAYADQVGEILADNKLPFFPDYTDHGVDHINQVLIAEIDLVPKEIWDKSTKESNPRLLTDIDAVLIIGATLLHDIAMHLRPTGLFELVSEQSRFQPLPWFKDNQENHKADRPWRDLWLDFQQEARRFNDKALANIIGLESVREGWKFDKLPENSGHWEENHRLIIGEFIRRHHARLAHEIAMYGFPGLDVGERDSQFSALGNVGHFLQRQADLIGLAARSHGLSLRVCQAYLDARYARQPKPMGSAVLYPMALLRVADYLQIDCQRTPAVLLKLRQPQSPISVQEWTKHRAIEYIGPAHDPRGKMITVSRNISHTIYLQLRELVAGLQKEMDHSIVVLDEVYGIRTDLGLDQLKLATCRIHSNLDDPIFRNDLPYVPERTGYAVDPNLLSLLVEPLYGKQPGVGVRELMQNAVDAVCELHAWCESHGKSVESLDLAKQDSDVQIDFIEREDGTWFLRVTDKGIGMTSSTIQNYFLRAGASFRQSSEWAKEFLNEQGKPRVARAGRFGIGVFAVFLLGSKFRLSTRHVSANNTEGYFVEAAADSQLIEISRKNDLKIGTTIEIEISTEAANKLKVGSNDINGLNEQTDWFCWDWPIVGRRVIRKSNDDIVLPQYGASLRKAKPSPEWSVIYPPAFDAVYWTFEYEPNISCNGIKIYSLVSTDTEADDKNDFEWPEEVQLKRPSIAILDSGANLPLTIRRYGLSNTKLAFITELCRDVTISFVAHALVCGPTSCSEAHLLLEKLANLHPLIRRNKQIWKSSLRWCSTSQFIVPADPWLYSLLNVKKCVISGRVILKNELISFLDGFGRLSQKDQTSFPFISTKNQATLSWSGNADGFGNESDVKKFGESFVKLIKSGFQLIEHNVTDIQIIIFCRKPDILEEIKKNIKIIYPLDSCYNNTPVSLLFLKNLSAPTLPLQKLFDETKLGFDDLFYFSEIKTKPSSLQPETLLAKIWNECLGANPIPFDPKERNKLIEHGRQHPDLKRHIEAWEEMRRTGSHWVTDPAV